MSLVKKVFRHLPLRSAVITAGAPVTTFEVDGEPTPFEIPPDAVEKELDVSHSMHTYGYPVVYTSNGVKDPFAVYPGYSRRQTRKAYLGATNERIGYHAIQARAEEEYAARVAATTKPSRPYEERVRHHAAARLERGSGDHRMAAHSQSDRENRQLGKLIHTFKVRKEAPTASTRESELLESFALARTARMAAEREAELARQLSLLSTDAPDYQVYSSYTSPPAKMTFVARNGRMYFRMANGEMTRVVSAKAARSLKGDAMRTISAAHVRDEVRQPVVNALRSQYEEVNRWFSVPREIVFIAAGSKLGEDFAYLSSPPSKVSRITPKYGEELQVEVAVRLGPEQTLFYHLPAQAQIWDLKMHASRDAGQDYSSSTVCQELDGETLVVRDTWHLGALAEPSPQGYPHLVVELRRNAPFRDEPDRVDSPTTTSGLHENPVHVTSGPEFASDYAGDGKGGGKSGNPQQGKQGKKGKPGPHPSGQISVPALEAAMKKVLLKDKFQLQLHKGKGLYNAGDMYQGSGKYKIPSAFKSVAKQAASAALKAGMKQGMSSLSAYAGSGDYTTTNELVHGSGEIQSLPVSFTTRKDETGNLRIEGREYIGDVLGSTVPFAIRSVDINPGLLSFCPKLSQIASNFKQYKMLKLIFFYKSTTSDIGASTTGQVGTVIIASSPNVNDPDFVGKRDMMDFKGAVSSRTTDNLIHGVECDTSKGGHDWLFVRSSPVIVNEDKKTYDAGLVSVAVANCPTAFAGFMIGELWCEYCFELKDFFLNTVLGNVIPHNHYCTPVTGSTAVGSNLMGGTAGVVLEDQQNNMDLLYTKLINGASLTFPTSFEGAICIMVQVDTIPVVAGGVLNAPTMGTTGAITPIKDIYNSAGVAVSAFTTPSVPIGNGGTVFTEAHFFVAPAQSGTNNVITIFGNSPTCTSLTSGDIRVLQYNSHGVNNTGVSGNFVVMGTGQVVSGNSI